MDNATPAEWMDAISDRLGSLIPGGYRLPPRHPLKVSLVMIVLGLMSGWATMLAGVVLEHWLPIEFRNNGFPFFAAAAAFFALFLFLPFACWVGVHRRWMPLLLLCVFFTSLASHKITVRFWFETHFNQLCGFDELYCLLWGTSLGAISLMLTNQIKLWWLLCMIVGTTFAQYLGNFPFYFDLVRIGSPFGLDLKAYILVVNYFTLIHMTAALTLGCLLWNANPRSKFEPIKGSYACSPD